MTLEEGRGIVSAAEMPKLRFFSPHKFLKERASCGGPGLQSQDPGKKYPTVEI